MQEESCSHLLSPVGNSSLNLMALNWKVAFCGGGITFAKKKWHIKLLRWCKTSCVFLTAQWHLLCFMVAVATQRSFWIWLSGQGQHWMKIRLYVINQVINLIKMDSLCFLFSEARERESASERHRECVWERKIEGGDGNNRTFCLFIHRRVPPLPARAPS